MTGNSLVHHLGPTSPSGLKTVLGQEKHTLLETEIVDEGVLTSIWKNINGETEEALKQISGPSVSSTLRYEDVMQAWAELGLQCWSWERK